MEVLFSDAFVKSLKRSLVSKIDVNSFFLARKCLISLNVICEPKFRLHFFNVPFRK